MDWYCALEDFLIPLNVLGNAASCGATIDRDVNDARNVLLKYIHYRKQESAWSSWRWGLRPRHLIVGCLVGLVLTYRFNVRGIFSFFLKLISCNIKIAFHRHVSIVY